MREPLLARNPDFDEVDLATLVGVANAIEQESAARYTALEQAMRRRGEVATADAFAAMCNEERTHIDAVQHWAATLSEPVPPAHDFEWRLPPELSQSWDEVIGSARLTPYRAFAIAVVNEQRAFALYSYLSAQAADPAVAAQAERLALEELRHAALMRRWRRKAWHEERPHAAAAPGLMTEDELRALSARHEAMIDVRLAAVAQRLRAEGDEDSARLLDGLHRGAGGNASAAPHDAGLADARSGSVPLLSAAQEPLEAYSEVLEGVLHANEGAVFGLGEAALTDVVRRIAQITRRIEQCGVSA